MKIEAAYVSKGNTLYTKDGAFVPLNNLITVDVSDILRAEDALPSLQSDVPLLLSLSYHKIEADKESYNEAFLAAFRDYLKLIEQRSIYVVIAPRFENNIIDASVVEKFIAAIKHTARRIKDCKSVIGFAIPKPLMTGTINSATDCVRSYYVQYIEELLQKHEHYLFFAAKNDIEASDCIYCLKEKGVILY